MIRAWTILEPKAKNPVSVGNGLQFQYPIFPTLKDAKQWLRIPLGVVWLIREIVVSCAARSALKERRNEILTRRFGSDPYHLGSDFLNAISLGME